MKTKREKAICDHKEICGIKDCDHSKLHYPFMVRNSINDIHGMCDASPLFCNDLKDDCMCKIKPK
jgi:hypothetical protein